MVGERLQNSPFQSKKVLMRKSPNGIYPESFAVMNREMMSSSLAESIPGTKKSGSLTRSSARVSERSLASFGIVMQDAIMPRGQNARNTVMFTSCLAPPKIESDGELKPRDRRRLQLVERNLSHEAFAGEQLELINAHRPSILVPLHRSPNS